MYNLIRLQSLVVPLVRRSTRCVTTVSNHHARRVITGHGNQSRNRQVLLGSNEDIYDVNFIFQYDNLWFSRYHESQSERMELAEKNVMLTLSLLDKYTKNMELKGELTICQAIVAERIVYQAKLQKRIQCGDGIQEALNEIAQLREFTCILHDAVKERELVLSDVQSCIQDLAKVVLNRPLQPSSDWTIVLKEAEYNANEYVALIGFLKTQDGWYPSLSWKEWRV
ncbi:hypothetical protein HOY80DRAFT_998693 [Tuber brumale]|nr:hypothetical protein HOY80DRAFT_998693 [Tuber brumale]